MASSPQKLLLELKVINDPPQMNNYISEAISALFLEFLVVDAGQAYRDSHLQSSSHFLIIIRPASSEPLARENYENKESTVVTMHCNVKQRHEVRGVWLVKDNERC